MALRIGAGIEQENYAVLMEAYFTERTQKRAMILVLDARRELSEDDEMMP